MQVLKNRENMRSISNITDREKEFLFHTYNRIPIEVEKAEGVYIISVDGKRYLDMFGGLAVNALGYGDKDVTDAIREQSEKYIHLSNYYLQQPQIDLAEKLVKYSGFSKVFFTNSGTESVEGAIKIARKWGKTAKKNNLISFTNSFHGRTMGSLSLMDKPNYKEGFGPFLSNFQILKYNNIDALRKNINKDTLAVILEFIQGEGGIKEATEEFVNEIELLKKNYGFLLIADEIQSGLGRTGKLFAYQHYGIQPDIVVIAKPLGGGLPLGAVLGANEVADVLQPGDHGTTFGGNPVACAAGIVVLRKIIENNVMNNAAGVGEYFKSALLKLKQKYPSHINEVRGKGLMLGMELKHEGDSVVKALREQSILINCTNQNVLRFLPPLTITEEHVDRTINELENVFKKT